MPHAIFPGPPARTPAPVATTGSTLTGAGRPTPTERRTVAHRRCACAAEQRPSGPDAAPRPGAGRAPPYAARRAARTPTSPDPESDRLRPLLHPRRRRRQAASGSELALLRQFGEQAAARHQVVRAPALHQTALVQHQGSGRRGAPWTGGGDDERGASARPRGPSGCALRWRCQALVASSGIGIGASFNMARAMAEALALAAGE